MTDFSGAGATIREGTLTRRNMVLENQLTHSHTMTPFDAPEKQAFRKHCWKRRNCS